MLINSKTFSTDFIMHKSVICAYVLICTLRCSVEEIPKI